MVNSIPPSDSPLKQCSSCPRILPATAEFFHRQHANKDNLCSLCKKCKSESDRKYRTENHEAILAGKKRYRQERAEALSTKQRAYYLEHQVERLSYKQNYNQTENGIIAKRADAHNRRARRKKAPGKHTTAQLREQFQSQEGKCYYCQCKLQHARDSWHADHVVPLSRGGSNDISNIVITCPPCNRAKHDKLPHEWINSQQNIK